MKENLLTKIIMIFNLLFLLSLLSVMFIMDDVYTTQSYLSPWMPVHEDYFHLFLNLLYLDLCINFIFILIIFILNRKANRG